MREGSERVMGTEWLQYILHVCVTGKNNNIKNKKELAVYLEIKVIFYKA